MSRVEALNQKYRLAKEGFQNGNSQLNVSPYYWSIYSNNRVVESNTPSQAVADNPRFIISAFIYHYQHYGWRKDTNLICYQNLSNEPLAYFSGIELNKWRLTTVKIWDCERIESATFELLANFEEQFTFSFDSVFPINSVQLLWKLFVEIDANCGTRKEAELYFNFFLKKLELENANLSIAEYQASLEEQKNLIKQHESLLNKIVELVS